MRKQHLNRGQEVVLATDHELSCGQHGLVVETFEWGALLQTEFGSRSYRAHWSEMELVEVTAFNGMTTHGLGYDSAGHVCSNCQGMRFVRRGACLYCEDCGESTGCS